jgi:hypothetical protein
MTDDQVAVQFCSKLLREVTDISSLRIIIDIAYKHPCTRKTVDIWLKSGECSSEFFISQSPWLESAWDNAVVKSVRFVLHPLYLYLLLHQFLSVHLLLKH